jgi:hypothetical protein
LRFLRPLYLQLSAYPSYMRMRESLDVTSSRCACGSLSHGKNCDRTRATGRRSLNQTQVGGMNWQRMLCSGV